MGLLYGLIGSLLGAVFGGITAIFLVAVATSGDDFAMVFTVIYLAPVGLILGGIFGIITALRLLRYVRANQENKQARHKNALVIAGSLLAVPALVVAMLWGVWRIGEPPSDQQLLNNFKAHRATFDKLIQMTQVDKDLMRVDYDWTQPSDPGTIGVSVSRIAAYRRLLDSVNVHRGFQAQGATETDFMYYATGSAFSSDTFKGYAYMTAPPKKNLPSLDDCRPNEKNGVQAYYHIEGCWYLYYDYLPG